VAERRAPVQASTREMDADGYCRTSSPLRPKGAPGAVPGTVSWEEHELAWRGYARLYGTSQSAERLAQRGGFSWWELVDYLGHEPTTWERRDG
jgi:hypothetical protein